MNAVEMVNITKSFGNVIANNQVNLSVEKGSIHALIGENGAGKSTLMNVLYGLIQPDKGELFINGCKIELQNPSEAIKLGIGMVHQHFMLAPSLTVLESVIIGLAPQRLGFVDYKKAEGNINKLNEDYSLNLDLNCKVYELTVGEMQRVEILKALYRNAEIIILDEPTAVLTPQETKELFLILKDLSKKGSTIIFISHKLKEVLAVSDKVTVMRNGKVTGTVDTKNTNEKEIARLMIGREVVFRVKKSEAHIGEIVFTVSDLCAQNNRGLTALKKVNLSIKSGEILGVAGVEGNGQTELVEVIAGLRKPTNGFIQYRGKDITRLSIRERREIGISHVPADRIRMGVDITSTIEENLIVNNYYKPPILKGMFLDPNNIRKYSKKLIDEYSIAAPDEKFVVGGLSGGNMQRVVLARELYGQPQLLISAQPTRGVDIGAIEYIHKMLLNLRDNGSAILLISSELDEIITLSDRIVVMYEGELVCNIQQHEANEEDLGLYMAGAKQEAHL